MAKSRIDDEVMTWFLNGHRSSLVKRQLLQAYSIEDILGRDGRPERSMRTL